VSGAIGDEARERVRDATDIAQVIGEHVALRRAGRSWKGLCPFHTEKTPSFTVTPDRQMWHCFGCNRGGDVFAFLMEKDKLSFPEALRALADRAGIELPKAERGPKDEVFDRLYQANALANDFFQASLRAPGGERARAYMAGRAFEEPWIERFQIGFAPEGWDGLLTALGKLLPARDMEEAGLVVRRGDGSGHYDRFRNRVMFPVAAAEGKIAGFGARALSDEDAPKYLNSPESPVFRKGRLLYGLPQARPSIRERREAIVAEGYLDVIRLHAAGFTNAVGTCGTALTSDHARAVARLNADVLLVYDGDDAGVRAADRALDALLQSGLQVRVLLLPRGEDPDSFLRKEGAAAFSALGEAALDVPSFLAGSRLKDQSAANPSLEARMRRLVELLRGLEDPIRRRLLLRRGAEVFGIEEGVLLEALTGKRGAKAKTIPGSARSKPDGGAGPNSSRGSAGESASAGITEAVEASDPIERELVARALTEEGAFQALVSEGGALCVRSDALRASLDPWIEAGALPLSEELNALLRENALVRAIVAELPHDPGKTLETSRREARDLILRLEERRLRASLQALDQAIRDAERSRDEGSLGRLIAERRDLASKLHTRSHSAIG